MNVFLVKKTKFRPDSKYSSIWSLSVCKYAWALEAVTISSFGTYENGNMQTILIPKHMHKSLGLRLLAKHWVH